MRYIVNKHGQLRSNYHKIHKEDCLKRPKEENRIDLGECMCPLEAKSRAKEYFSSVTGCKYCCKEIFFEK